MLAETNFQIIYLLVEHYIIVDYGEVAARLWWTMKDKKSVLEAFEA